MENELVVQVSMKHEIELAMKLLEKDIHEKQDTLIGLRQQLDEVKAINMEMYQKLQVEKQSAVKLMKWLRTERDALQFCLVKYCCFLNFLFLSTSYIGLSFLSIIDASMISPKEVLKAVT